MTTDALMKRHTLRRAIAQSALEIQNGMMGGLITTPQLLEEREKLNKAVDELVELENKNGNKS